MQIETSPFIEPLALLEPPNS